MPTNLNLGRTELLDETALNEDLHAGLQMSYRPVPSPNIRMGHKTEPVWRVRFEPVDNPDQKFGLDINGKIIFGRGTDLPNIIDMTPFGAETLGVSRHHLSLKPTPTNLFAIDQSSTNGTFRNGRSIGIQTPYALMDGDMLTLGRLKIRLHIIERPHISTAPLQKKELNLVDALSQIAKAITSQLNIDQVLNQVAAIALSLTAAGEAGIWLVDEQTGDLFLEAERGMQDGRAQRKRFQYRDNSLVGRVIRTGKSIRARKKPGEDHIEVTTGYLVEALVYVPIALGGITFGVLTAVHRKQGDRFDEQDEQLLTAVADFAAIAIQNARLFQATDQALQSRVRELSALNEVSRSISSSLDLDRVYDVLLEEVNKYCPVEAVRLYLLNAQRNSLYPLGKTEELHHFRSHPVDRGILGTAVKNGETIISNNATKHPNYEADLQKLNGRDISSIICIPLKIKNRVVGVLSLSNKQDNDFNDEDVSLLESFAAPIATAIENARLFAESERQRIVIQATADTLSQPLMVLDTEGNLLVANEAVNNMVETHLAQMLNAVSYGVGRTVEVAIGENTFLSTTEHLPDVGTIIVMQDITYVKKLEKDRAEFMHMLSHDLKNPLMAITGWSSMLERTVLLDEQGTQFIGEINIASDRMLKMINQLLDTVTQEDAFELVRVPCHLDKIMAQIVNDVRGATLSKSIQIFTETHGDSSPIFADETRIYHMLLNLVDNAIKYSPKKTQIDLLLNFNLEDITIRVQDEGSGIPVDDLERIFDKYYRSNNKDKASGSGLGLATVKGITEAHGGTVIAENRAEKGTAFIITLPMSIRLANSAAE